MVNRQWRACNLSRQICILLSSQRFTYVKRSRVHYFLVMMIYVGPISEPEREMGTKQQSSWIILLPHSTVKTPLLIF